MTRPRTVSDQAILDATRACILERGPGVALDVIAERVGLSSPALIKRFQCRRGLIVAALRPTDPPPWLAIVAAGPDDRPLQAQLADLIERVFEFFEVEMPCITALTQAGHPMTDVFEEGELPLPLRNIWSVADWLRRARDKGLIGEDAIDGDDYESVAISMLGGLHGRVFLRQFMGTGKKWRRSRKQYVADVARLFARALAPRTPTSTSAPRAVRSKKTPSRTKPSQVALPQTKRKKS